MELENGKSIEYTSVGVSSSVSQCSESNYNYLNIHLQIELDLADPEPLTILG